MNVRSFCARMSVLCLLAGAAGTAFGQGKILLYIPDNARNEMAEYGIDPLTGNPTPFPSQATNNGPWDVAVTPNNKFIYVGQTGGFIDEYIVDPIGATTPGPTPVTNNGTVLGIAIDTTGNYLFASDNAGNRLVAYSINQVTGQLAFLSSTTVANPKGMVVDVNNHLYVVRGSSAFVEGYQITGTGGLISIGATATGASFASNRVAVNPAGTLLFSSNTFDNSLTRFTITPGTGVLSGATLVPIPVTGPLGLAVHQNGTILLVTDFNHNSANVFSFVIGGGGSLTPAPGSPFSAGSQPSGVAFDPTGTFAYVSNTVSGNITKFAVNTGTGALSLPSFTGLASGARPEFLISRPAPLAPTVPALSTWSFVLLGMLLAGSSIVMYKRSYR
jgi:6-phosphogluconolactonase (cycloisomerase 2 family)